MSARCSRWFGSAVSLAILLALLPTSPDAAVGKDPFSKMRIRRLAMQVPPHLVLPPGIDGRPIRFSDFRGKAVLVEFFVAN